MKRLAALILVTGGLAGLAGCVAVPVAEPPGAYAAPPPAVVVQPYFYGGYYYGGHYGYHRGYRHWR